MKSIIFHDHDLNALVHKRKKQIRIPYLSFQNTTALVPPATRPPCPYGEAGDVLAIKEAWRPARNFARAPLEADYSDAYVPRYDRGGDYEYMNDVSPLYLEESGVWYQAESMPVEAARHHIQLTSVRLERVQSLTIEAALAEGMPQGLRPDADPNIPIFAFAAYWDDLYGAGSWDLNQVVWVLEFEQLPSKL